MKSVFIPSINSIWPFEFVMEMGLNLLKMFKWMEVLYPMNNKQCH